jgi:hypothetical protein
MSYCKENKRDMCQAEVIVGCKACDSLVEGPINIMDELKHQTSIKNIVRYSTSELVNELRKRKEVRALDITGFYDEFFITTSKSTVMDEDEIEESGPAIILIIK